MEVFTIAPADTKFLWLIGLIPLLVLVLVVGILWASITSARSATFELSSDGRAAERVDLDCDGARIRRWLVPVPSPGEEWAAALATAGPPPAVCCRAWPGE